MIKKLLSVSTAVLLFALAALPFPAAAEDSGDRLRKVASSFGADTDYLALQNFAYDLPYGDDLSRYRHFVPLVPQSTVREWSSELPWYSDISLGVSRLEITSHNGSLYDFDQEVSCLKDVAIEDYVISIAEIRQELFDQSKFRLAAGYRIHTQSPQEKIAALLETAQVCGDLGKYFLIMYGSYPDQPLGEDEKNSGVNRPLSTHCAVGLGVCHGSWQFGDRTFDCCIMTLDNENIEELGEAFNERTCIYVDSETLDYYVPYYSDSVEGELHIIGLYLDELEEEAKNVTDVCLFNKDYYMGYTVLTIDDDGVMYSLDEYNDFEDEFHSPLNNEIFLETRPFTVLCRAKDSTHHFSRIYAENYYRKSEASLTGRDSDLTVTPNSYKVKCCPLTEDGINQSKKTTYQIYSKDNDGTKTRLDWLFSGKTSGSAYYELKDKTVLFDPGDVDEPAAVWMTCDDGASGFNYWLKLYTSNPVLVALNKDFEVDLFIDPDGDGEFDKAVESGDVNCDGYVDASDASLVLVEYATALTGGEGVLNFKRADVNGDNTVDASDASEILVIYSGRMTS